MWEDGMHLICCFSAICNMNKQTRQLICGPPTARAADGSAHTCTMLAAALGSSIDRSSFLSVGAARLRMAADVNVSRAESTST